jgi:hypothetical protein
MKTDKFYNTTILMAMLVKAIIAEGNAWLSEVCEATLDCPVNYEATDTLKLPSNIISLSKVFKHCAPTYFDESYAPGHVDTISLFFVIDHSGSMSVSDSNSIRYKLTSSLIDSLHASSPASEVGIVVFSNQLMHNASLDHYAVKLDSSSSYTDAFIPLTQLNSTVSGQTAADYLKSVIALSPTERDAGNNRKLINGYYGENGRHNGQEGFEQYLSQYNGTTDITLAFEAARKAFQKAKYPRSKQYIIFLSDGEPQNVDLERRPFINDFKTGTDLPATFTAYWVNNSQPIPKQIIEMTENIKNNGYSSSNLLSEVWKTQGDINELLAKLLKISKGHGFREIPSTPVRLQINNDTAVGFDDTYAYFNKSFALQNPLTRLSIKFTYHYAPPMDIDSTRSFDLIIKSVQGIELPSDITAICRDQGIIRFFVNGVEATGILSDDQKNIEIRFYPPEPMDLNSVPLTISNSVASLPDTLKVNAIKQGQYYTVTIARQTASPKTDNLLQTAENDSIVAFYQNPNFPLDIVRATRAIGAARNLGLVSACFLDQDADGFPDVIRVTEASDKITSEELEQIKPNLYFTGARPISIISLIKTGAGFDIIIKVNDNIPNTSALPDELLIIQTVSNLSSGGIFPSGSVIISDSMAPVIKSASFRNGKSTGNVRVSDTLIVTFSEKTEKIEKISPFKLMDPVTKVPYSLEVTNISGGDGVTQTFLVNSINGKAIVSPNDSIWINEKDSVSDNLENMQTNANNRRVTLQTNDINYNFTVTVGPTPVNPKTYTIPYTARSQFKDGSVSKGVIILIKSSELLLPQDSVSAKISIYDQVGNAVLKDEKCVSTSENGKLLYLWNGVNKNGRYVGEGTYLAVVNIKVSNGVSQNIKTKIGILYH